MCQASVAEPFDDRRKQRRWNGEVVQGVLGVGELLLERSERGGVVVVAVDVLQQRDQAVEGRLIVDAVSVTGDAVANPRAELVEI